MRQQFGRRRRRMRQNILLEGSTILLSELPVDQEARIVNFSGCGHFIRHINNMGCYRGAIIKKIQNFGHHSMIQVGECKFGMGRRAINKIIVEPINKEKENIKK